MSAKVSTFSRGVTFVSSGETGTQATEFEAAIKSVTSATTVGAVFVYDTRNDSDGGAWRKKARGSWYYETLNTATRGGRREFPSVALIVGDTNSTTTSRTLTIYDLDDPAMPMWMQFTCTASTWLGYLNLTSSGVDITSIYALNGRIYLGADTSANGGLLEINFADDSGGKRHSGIHKNFIEPISSRNSSVAVGANNSSGYIVDSGVNDVAATVLEGAEIGALNLPIPTIACATNDGVSVIHGGSGAVYDIKGNQTYKEYKKVFFTDDGKVGFNYEASGTQNRAVFTGIEPVPYADKTTGGIDWAVEKYAEGNYGNHASNEFGLATTTSLNSSNDAIPNAVVPTTKTGLAFGYPDRLSIVKRNTGYDKEGAVAYVTSDYNTGYMLGDIRFAGLANNKVTDRSVKANTLTQNGSVGSADVATGAELKAYNSFSASNFLSRASADLGTSMNLGTTATVMAWVKVTEGSGYQTVCNYNTTSAGVGWQILIDADEKPYFYIYGASATVSSDLGPALTAGKWHQVVGVNTGSRVQIYVDGKLGSDDAGVAGSMDNSSANFNIGIHTDQASLPWLGSLSLVRVSKTAATPQQVKDIYRAEAPLFRAGAKCLLQSDNGSEEDKVNDLAYDSSTGLLHVFQNGQDVAESRFRGLEMVESYGGKSNGWNNSTTTIGAAAGGVHASARTAGTGGVIVDLPPFDVRGDTNIADTKLPDDGKLHFTGVTTDATQTVIANIPMEELETMSVEAIVTGHNYQAASTNRVFTHIRETFNRNLGGNIQEPGDHYKLENLGTASCDVTLTANTTSNTVQIKVTGVAGNRMQWNATVAVQRITERSYER